MNLHKLDKKELVRLVEDFEEVVQNQQQEINDLERKLDLVRKVMFTPSSNWAEECEEYLKNNPDDTGKDE